jgi:uncharacterized protein YcfJ
MRYWKVIGTLIVVGAASQPVAAWSGGYAGQSDDDFVVEAPVVDVEPLVRMVEVVTPREVCRDEPVYQAANHYRSKTPLVVGGIIGGAIGNAIGDGRRSRRALTAVGALLGASIGYDQSRRNMRPARTYVTSQRVCEIEQVVHREERVDGYRVTYEYRGRHFVTHTVTAPGATIRVGVRVQPLA